VPFRSEKQRKFLWAKKPEIAEKWAREAKKAERSKKRKHTFKRQKDD
jgi:hypothetical protein